MIFSLRVRQCGLCPLQHVDVAALLIKYGSPINATDRWSFTPLHEAAQKGRTQLCSLLILHGADVNMKNQEGQIPYDLATVSCTGWILHVLVTITTYMYIILSIFTFGQKVHYFTHCKCGVPYMYILTFTYTFVVG